MRILHLIDPGRKGGCSLRTLADVVARFDGFEHDVLVLGTAAHAQIVRRSGVETIGSASVVGRGRAVAAVIRAYEKARGRYDLVHSWTQRAGAVAFGAAPRRRHIVNVSSAPEQGRVASVLQVSRARIIAPFESVRAEWIASGFDAGAVGVVPPAVDERAIDREVRVDDDNAPAGGDGVNGRPFTIGMIHEPAGELDANIAMTIAARLALASIDVRVLVHPDAHRRAEAEMVSHRLGFSHELLIVEADIAEPWRIVGALDAAVRFGGRRPGGDLTPLMWAMAAGVPVVAAECGAAREVIEDDVTGSIVAANDVNAVCGRLVRLHEDRDAARRIGEAASRAARERFSIEAHCERLMREYEAIVRK